MHSFLDMHKGLKVLGMRHRERVIPQGTTLTAVGEVTMARIREDAGGGAESRGGGFRISGVGAAGWGGGGSEASDSGSGGGSGGTGEGSGGGGEHQELRLRRPQQEGHVFTVTHKPFDEYVRTFGTAGKVCGVGCAILVGVGAGMMVGKLARARMVRWRENRFRRRLATAEKARQETTAAAAAAAAAATGTGAGLGETCASRARGARVGGSAASGGSGTLSPGSGASASGGDAAAASTDVPLSACVSAGDDARRPGETCVVCLFAEACVCYKDCGHLVGGSVSRA